MSKLWNIRVCDVADYIGIEAETEEEAKHIAWDWFHEREPEFDVEEVDAVIPDSADVYLVSHYIKEEEETICLGYVALYRKRINAVNYSMTNSVPDEDYFLVEEKSAGFARAARLMDLLKD